MTFVKGQPRPANAGRKKGSPRNQTRADIKAVLALKAPEIAHELVRLALSAKREETRVAAAREVLDRVIGKATQPVEGQVLFGVSAELSRLLEQHDGRSRSIPLISHEGINGASDLNGVDDDHGRDCVGDGVVSDVANVDVVEAVVVTEDDKKRPDGLKSHDHTSRPMQLDDEQAPQEGAQDSEETQ